jgi:hypothetical protein
MALDAPSRQQLVLAMTHLLDCCEALHKRAADKWTWQEKEAAVLLVERCQTFPFMPDRTRALALLSTVHRVSSGAKEDNGKHHSYLQAGQAADHTHNHRSQTVSMLQGNVQTVDTDDSMNSPAVCNDVCAHGDQSWHLTACRMCEHVSCFVMTVAAKVTGRSTTCKQSLSWCLVTISVTVCRMIASSRNRPRFVRKHPRLTQRSACFR